MKKLDDIPKKNVFEVPEGYFDRLPGVIQARIAKPEPEISWIVNFRMGLRYALPVFIFGVASVFYFRGANDPSTEDLLASIDSATLVAYLAESDITTEEILESITLDHEEVDTIEKNLMETNMDDDDLQNLSDELGTDYF